MQEYSSRRETDLEFPAGVNVLHIFVGREHYKGPPAAKAKMMALVRQLDSY